MSSDRHSRHRLFAGIGDAGQSRLAQARVAIVGCGALGSHSAEILGRAGVGREGRGLLRLIDRDYVEETNLQRQALYDDEDARRAVPKATAAARHLRAIDPELHVEDAVRDLSPENALELLDDVDLILDGTDNFATRFVINDAAIAKATPWIYGGAIASRGVIATIVPSQTPCFRCFMEAAPPVGVADTCDTAGVISSLPALVAAMQATEAMRYLVSGEFSRGMRFFDFWHEPESLRTLFAGMNPLADCRSCGTGELPALHGEREDVVPLCGRNSVQIFSDRSHDLDAIAMRFANLGVTVERHSQSLSADTEGGRVTLFADGRVIVEGTTDPLAARSIVSRFVGN